MPVTLLAGSAVLAVSMAVGDQNGTAPSRPDPSQQQQLEVLRDKLSDYLRQQEPGAKGPYSNLFGAPHDDVAPRQGDAVTREQVATAAPEKTIVCGMTVWHARVDPDPRLRISAPVPRGEFSIRTITPPVCTDATDTERGPVLTPRRR